MTQLADEVTKCAVYFCTFSYLTFRFRYLVSTFSYITFKFRYLVITFSYLNSKFTYFNCRFSYLIRLLYLSTGLIRNMMKNLIYFQLLLLFTLSSVQTFHVLYENSFFKNFFIILVCQNFHNNFT